MIRACLYAPIVLAGLVALSLVAGCVSSPYQLPDPPSADERRDVAADPAAQADQQRQRYLASRASLLKLYELLSQERFEQAESLLSQQTRDFLAFGTDHGDASAALASGTLNLPDGRAIDIDPVSFLIAPEVRRIEDTRDGVQEHETQRRLELFVIDDGGQARRVVMIVEGDRWVLHKTSFKNEAE